MRKREKALIFYEHIEKHLQNLNPSNCNNGYLYEPKVMCKICNKTVNQIVKEKQIEETLNGFRKAQNYISRLTVERR